MASGIKFGTDGWRGITADDFTFANVLLVTEAIRRHLNSEGAEERVLLVGYDTRFLAREFAEASAAYLARKGMKVRVSPGTIPTPAVAFAVRHFGAAGAIMFTASHNPFYYNGLKFIPDYAGPAMPEATDDISAFIGELSPVDFEDEPPVGDSIDVFDIKEAYFEHLGNFVNAEAMADAGLRVLYNPLWATGTGWLDELLIRYGVDVEVMNAERDVLFGGSMPDPSEGILKEESDRLKAGGFHLGLATDGDSDRFAALDSSGVYYSPNRLIPLIAHYLVDTCRMPGDVVRTVATSALLDRISRVHRRRLIETKVGFKYVGYELRGGALLGGEESGGFSMAGHVPEKDGILACLLTCEAAAVLGGGDLAKCFEILDECYGPSITRRNDLRLTDEGKREVMEQARVLAEHYGERGGALWGLPVVKTVTIDGIKFVLEGDRSIMIRESGTEPIIRVYLEAPELGDLEELDEKSSRWIEATGGG